MDMQELGLRIRERRKELKLTQAELAESTGLGRSTLNRLENGRLDELGLRKFLAICARLELQVNLLDSPALPSFDQLLRERQAEHA